MKPTTLARAFALLTILAAAPVALAQTPALLTYQGRVQTGTPAADFTGTGQFKFALVAGTANVSVQATATATRTGSFITGYTVVNQGAGYVTAPTVTITGGGGSGATATAVLTGDKVTSITPGSGGTGYTGTPTVTIGAPPPRQELLWVNDGALTADPVTAVSLPVSNGLYSVLLGDTSITNMGAIPPAVFARPDVRLRVWFNGTQLSPDQRLAPSGYLPGGTTVGGGFLVSNDINFLANGNHTFSVARQTVPDVAGNRLTVEAGSTLGSGSARAGGALHLKAGNGYTGDQPNAGGGDVIISSGANWGAAQSGFVNGGDIVFNTGGPNNSFPERMRIVANGNVGIGTTTPTQAKLVVGGFTNSKAHPNNTYGYLGNAGAVANSAAVVNENSIYGEYTIWAGGYIIASSDERIKNIRGLSDTGSDLKTLRGIQVTDYDYKDTITKGAVPQKKVIAQQVEKVFPMAVSRQTDVVPDIFKKAPVKDGWITLKTDLKKGDRVRLTDDKTMAVHEVLEVNDDKFRTAFKPEGDEVFVYGREVNDFRTVDYDAIAMLNVSATQELARRLEAKDAEVLALQKENAALKAELATQASKDKAQDDKLAALATLLEQQAATNAAAASPVSTVSVNR